MGLGVIWGGVWYEGLGGFCLRCFLGSFRVCGVWGILLIRSIVRCE